jgi:parallel beta-helix repeat protein
MKYLAGIFSAVIIGVFSFCAMAEASTFYVDATGGSDSNNGLSDTTAWKTIVKVNSGSFNPGDFILFKRGEIWQEPLVVPSSGANGNPITFGAYGTGEKPVISGFASIASWNNLGGNIWESSTTVSTLSTVNIVTVNGVDTPMGRYPNIGYLTFESHSGTASIIDNELSGSPNWTGAEAVIRSSQWTLDRTTITAQLGGTLTFSPTITYEPTNGFGYFIQNDVRTLDVANEWYYNPATKKLRIYSASIPTNVRAARIDVLATVNGHNYITFDNISFLGSNSYSASLTNSKFITIQNSDFNFSGKDTVYGFSGGNSTGLKIDNCSINYSHNRGIYLASTFDSAVIQSNTINNTGIVPGMGQSRPDQYVGINSNGGGLIFEFNKIINAGSGGIEFEGSSILIKNNLIDTYDTVLQDDGGIYTMDRQGVYTNKKIISNIVLNGIGATAGTNNSAYIPAEGIYLDDSSRNVEVASNTIANMANQGIYLHNAHDNNIHDNTVYNSARQLGFQQDTSGFQIQNNTINNNIFVAKLPTQLVLYYSNGGTFPINSLGSADNNYYARPIDDNLTFNLVQSGSLGSFNYNYNLAQWQSYSGLDANSQKSPVAIPAYAVNSLIGNNKFSNGTFNSNVSGTYTWSPINTCIDTWDNTGQLDGGSQKISFSSVSTTTNTSLNIIGIGAIDSNKNYILRFSVKGTKNAKLEVMLRKTGSPYTIITPVKSFNVSASRTEQDFLFSKPNSSESSASIQFYIDEADGTVYFDNIELYEADVSIPNPDDYLRFEYNASISPKVVSLGGITYVDVKNNYYADSVTVDPWSSVVLIKYVDTTAPIAPSNLAGAAVSKTSINLTWTASTDNVGVAVYRIYRNGTQVGTSVAASYSDTGLTAGTQYSYMVVAYDAAGNPSASATAVATTISSSVSSPSSPLSSGGGGGGNSVYINPVSAPEIKTPTSTANISNNIVNSSTTPQAIVIPQPIITPQSTISQYQREAQIIFAQSTRVAMSSATVGLYVKVIAPIKVAITDKVKFSLAEFIHNGTDSTKKLGAGERAGVVDSFRSAFLHLPAIVDDWSDVIKIANGRWTTQTSPAAEAKAKITFKKIYLRPANLKNQNDNAAINIMAYGLRPAQRNTKSEKAAIISFKYIYKKAPTSAEDWNIVRAIAYSGAKR